MYVHMKDMTVKSVCCCLKLLTHKFPIISHFHTFLARKRIVWGGGGKKKERKTLSLLSIMIPDILPTKIQTLKWI